jgi:hypothetical protein
MRSRLLTLGAVLPLLAVPLALSSGASQGAPSRAAASHAGITGVTRTISAGPAVAFPRPSQGTVGAPASPEINPASPAEGDPADGVADKATKRALAKARGGFTFNRQVPGEVDRSGRASRHQSGVIVRNGPQLRGSFHALDHFDSRTADNGNQFSNEPPDQGLCVGNGKVFESVNTAVQVYDKNGTGHGVTSLNKFYGLASAFVRPNGPFGPNVFDPTCVFDPQTKTFFQVADDLGVDPATGNLNGQALLDIAVTKHPLGKWQVYQLDVTDDGSNGTPVHDGCPCFGDYPHIGFDRNGFYIDTNEFSIFGPEFDGAQVYAFDKSELARGAARIHVTQFDTTGADQGNGGFTVWPAQSPSSRDFNNSNGGTEFFMSSNAVFTDTGVSDNIVVWSMTHTNSLGRNHPNAVLQDARVPVQTYSVPPPVVQKPGPAPLLECLNDPTCRPFVADPGPPEELQTLDSNDSRMQQVAYTGGRLYSSLDTAIDVAGETHAGISWFVLNPRSNAHSVAATVRNQGQLGLAHNDLTYPAVGVTSQGRGVMAFTLAGSDFFPSAAYTDISASGVGPIHVAAAGLGPQDGFAGYNIFNAPNPARPRWGDYGAASADGSDVWIASEYIGQTCTLAEYETAPFGTCGNTRTALANWGTRISVVRP